MGPTPVDGHRERHRRRHAPTAGVLLDVLCWILNAGNPAPRSRRADAEIAPARR